MAWDASTQKRYGNTRIGYGAPLRFDHRRDVRDETSFLTKLDLLAVQCNEPAFAPEEDKTAHLWQNSKHQCALVIAHKSATVVQPPVLHFVRADCNDRPPAHHGSKVTMLALV